MKIEVVLGMIPILAIGLVFGLLVAASQIRKLEKRVAKLEKLLPTPPSREGEPK